MLRILRIGGPIVAAGVWRIQYLRSGAGAGLPGRERL